MKIASEQEMLAFGKKFAEGSTWAGGAHRRTPKIFSEGKILGDNVRQDPPSSATVIELIGDVGAGKTTFVRGFAKGLGIKEPITSPSFTISKSYPLKTGGNLIHYDFYRLKDPGLMSDNLKEVIANSQNIIIVEWGNSVEKILPKNRIKIKFFYDTNDSRRIIIKDNFSNTFSGACATDGEHTERLSPVTTGAKEHTPKSITKLSLYLDTSTPETILKLNDKEYRENFDRDLAEKLLKFIHNKLRENQKDFETLTEITFMSGPGSFTGLRIGATVVNTLAKELNIPLYDHNGKKHQIIIPNYGRSANISAPKK